MNRLSVWKRKIAKEERKRAQKRVNLSGYTDESYYKPLQTVSK